FNGREILSLNILDKSDFIWIPAGDNSVDVHFSQELVGSKTPLASNEEILSIIHFLDCNRLYEAMGIDGVGKLFQAVFVKEFPRLIRVWQDVAEVDFKDSRYIARRGKGERFFELLSKGA